MSLPRYPEYKDSGVAWLGEVPAHWLVTPVKRFGRLKGGAGFPHVEQGHESEDLPFHKVNALGRSGSDGVLWGSENNISQATAERLGAYVFPAESLVFAKVGAALLLGRIRVLGEPACIDNNMMGLVVDRETADFAFVSYALNLVRFDLIANPGAVPSLNEGQIGNFPLVLPSRAEQSAIAAFLDHETGKIDALIAEQEKLLTLLAEKRQATISHAVTRGLNPNAPMKDSGALWLGEVPLHWNVTKLKFATSLIVDCPHETPVYDEAGPYKVIRTADITAGVLDSSEMYSVTEDEYQSRIRRQALFVDDIVYGREGERWGFAALVPTSNSFCLGQRMMQFRPSSSFNSKFLMWQLNTLNVYRQGQMDVVGATSPHVNVGTIRNYVLTEPPLDEQIEIAVFLATEVSKIDKLKVEAECAITLLRERRSALIAAAVTGKIDVRARQ